jgi:Amidases related to nicotinamidase
VKTPLSPLGRRAAVVTIDLHRGHLDTDVATMPLPAAQAKLVTRANAEFITAARALGLPVIHVVTAYRNVEEISSNPWWSSVAGTDATRSNVLNHQLPGSPGLELMADVYEPGYDAVVRTKKRYDCFLHTDLELALRSLGIDTLLLTGVNTNSCVIATTIAASVRDFSAIVLSDCVATMDSKLHQAALDVIAGAFGWVMDSHDAIDRIAAAQENSNA